ncbi:40s ribosomal protein S13 [Gregarina niphandrodes]|uniref:40s ribosomal protein S13 n=1 Tax=Gregarina niphandrodes TaxID=110365 RepID=A0A023BD36_GRENI|nr:40s ribosomal protein S13 [Gregarina niphandrodes]EZG87292.1 40s ribosomal protein S13 [Gregarina niphandrodes]|eukprot:XP_011128669.1 40s ribosomal protein S13 [Gregarina niphandrodes]
MARMYGKKKGIARSALPYVRDAPTWSKVTPEEVITCIEALAKKGMTPSQIGIALRDSQAVPRVKAITGTLITRILRKRGLANEVPEDLYFLMKKAVNMRKHLERAHSDISCKYRVGLTESKIHRLARYYRSRRRLPATWKYTAAKASAIVA